MLRVIRFAAVAALAGFLVLSQSLGARELVAIGLVVAMVVAFFLTDWIIWAMTEPIRMVAERRKRIGMSAFVGRMVVFERVVTPVIGVDFNCFHH